MHAPQKSRPVAHGRPGRSRRQPKTLRGQKVAEKVAEVARALLIAEPLHKVSVVSIAKAAKLPRASVLLQFPDGIPDIVELLLHEEEDSTSEEEQRQLNRRRPRTGVDLAMVMVEVVLSRGEASGFLYANILSEALQFGGTLHRDFRASLVFLGLGILGRSLGDPNRLLITPRNIALAETLARTLLHLAATSPTVMDLPQQPSKAEIFRILLEGVIPKIEAA